MMHDGGERISARSLLHAHGKQGHSGLSQHPGSAESWTTELFGGAPDTHSITASPGRPVRLMCTIWGQSGCAPAGSTEPTGGLWLRAGEMDWAREARAGPS